MSFLQLNNVILQTGGTCRVSCWQESHSKADTVEGAPLEAHISEIALLSYFQQEKGDPREEWNIHQAGSTSQLRSGANDNPKQPRLIWVFVGILKVTCKGKTKRGLCPVSCLWCMKTSEGFSFLLSFKSNPFQILSLLIFKHEAFKSCLPHFFLEDIMIS